MSGSPDLGGGPGADFPLPEIDANGVDRSQIRHLLGLAPGDRLRQMESLLASVLRIRRGIRRTEVPPDPPAPR